MFFAVARNFIFIVGAMAIALCGAAAQGVGDRSPQAAIALQFLSLLEQRQIARAHRMLAPSVARAFGISRLAAASPSGAARGINRQVRFEGQIPLGMAYAEKLSVQQTGRGLAGATAYIVCLADVPKSGYGSVTYITVILVGFRTRSSWQVSEYRSQSEPEIWCRH